MVEGAQLSWRNSAGGPPGQLVRLLELLQPGVLASLEIDHCAFLEPETSPSPVLAALQRLTGLHTLRLVRYDLPACMAEALACLSQLESLHLKAYPIPSRVVRAVAQLAALTHLRLWSSADPREAGDMLGLTRLRQLRHLELAGGRAGDFDAPAVLVPRPAAFPQLCSFGLRCCKVSGTHNCAR